MMSIIQMTSTSAAKTGMQEGDWDQVSPAPQPPTRGPHGQRHGQVKIVRLPVSPPDSSPIVRIR